LKSKPSSTTNLRAKYQTTRQSTQKENSNKKSANASSRIPEKSTGLNFKQPVLSTLYKTSYAARDVHSGSNKKQRDNSLLKSREKLTDNQISLPARTTPKSNLTQQPHHVTKESIQSSNKQTS
jgi:hypothetical protein